MTEKAMDIPSNDEVIPEETKNQVAAIEEPKVEPETNPEPMKAEVAPKPVKQAVVAKPKPKPQPRPKSPVTTKPQVKPQTKPVVRTPAPTKSFARVYFHKTVHEFGEIDEGDQITAKFKFTNTGKTPLTIDNVDVSCGCTMPTFPIVPIGPGENGEIGVVYNSKGKFGTQKPTLTVKTNAVDPITKLYLSGSIKHVFEKVKTDSITVESDSTSIED